VHQDRSAAVDDSIKRSDVGRFIAENLKRDPASNVSGPNAVKFLVEDLGEFLGSVASELINFGDPTATRAVKERFTKLLGADNLVGSAGEFGFCLPFCIAHRAPRTWTESQHCRSKMSEACSWTSVCRSTGTLGRNTSRLDSTYGIGVIVMTRKQAMRGGFAGAGCHDPKDGKTLLRFRLHSFCGLRDLGHLAGPPSCGGDAR
jgi:hypothetical protein